MDGAPSVVVVGADREPTTSLLRDLERLGYRPTLVAWPRDTLEWEGPRPPVVVVDLRELGLDAARVCQWARVCPALRRAPQLAVAPEHEAPRLDLTLGFDDLLLAPYRLPELLLRLRLLRWRSEGGASEQVIRAGPLVINQANYQVSVAGAPVELTLREYELLVFLARHPRRVFTRSELLDRVWGAGYFGGTRTVDVHIRRLRAKTEAAGNLLQTVRGIGYRFAPPK